MRGVHAPRARIVIGHAVLAQWLKADREGRGQLSLQQRQVERARWLEVVLDVNFDPRDPHIAALTERENREGLARKHINMDEVFHTQEPVRGQR